jgi:hypothetical protein
LREIGQFIKAASAVIGGEIVALDEDGLPTFDGLRLVSILLGKVGGPRRTSTVTLFKLHGELKRSITKRK